MTPADYEPSKTVYNRFIRWSRLEVFNKIFSAVSAKGGKPDQLTIDEPHLKGTPDRRQSAQIGAQAMALAPRRIGSTKAA